MSAATSGAFAMPEPEGGAGFVALYRTHASFTWACLRRLGVPPAAIDDAMQELWVTAHRRIDTLHGPASAKAWLFGIARRVASHHRRSEQRHRRKLDELGRASGGADSMGSRESELVVESILAQLDARVREAFVLSELEGWSAPEIARATGANTNTIYWRVRVARQELQSQLGETEGEVGARVIQLRDATRPPRGAAKHCWVLIAPKLAKPGLLATLFGSFGALKAAAVGAAITVVSATAIEASTHAPERSGSTPRATDDVPTETVATAVATPVAAPPPPAGAALEAPAIAAPSEPAPPRPARASAREEAPAPTPSGLAAQETELLGAAKLAFTQGRADDARAALREHRERWPQSRLADLRDLLDVELRCAGGDTTGARTVAATIVARAPASSIAAKLAKTCAGGAAP